MRVVKRYSNRRLYDTQTSRTVTHFELARMIREGHEVQVLDSVTGRDITVEILSRVMVNEATRESSLDEARELLKDLIVTGGSKSMSILRNTILASIGVINVTKKKAEEIIDELINKGDLDRSDRKKAVMELLEKAEKSTADFRKKVVKEADKAQKNVSKFTTGLAWATRDDFAKMDGRLKRLTKRVKDLEAKLSE